MSPIMPWFAIVRYTPDWISRSRVVARRFLSRYIYIYIYIYTVASRSQLARACEMLTRDANTIAI